MNEQVGLSAGRRAVVGGFIACLVGLQLLDVARKGENWPFAQYAMYASEHGGEIHWNRVYGVTPTGEFPLDRPAYFPPFDMPRLSYAFAPRPSNPNVVVPSTPELLRVVGQLYEHARLAGRHHGPPLIGLRAYQLTWRLDPTLANRDEPVRLLLGEVRQGE